MKSGNEGRVSRSKSGQFEIHFDSGEIQLNLELDYELTSIDEADDLIS